MVEPNEVLICNDDVASQEHSCEATSSACSEEVSTAWRMLFSHHPPCDLGRTWRIFGINVCVRCLGMAIGGILTLALATMVGISYSKVFGIMGVLLMLPAGVDFTCEELWQAYPASNVLRFITGFLFGVGGGSCLAWWLGGTVFPILIFVVVAVVMQFAIALIFMKCVHLEEYLRKYEEAIEAHGCTCHAKRVKSGARSGVQEVVGL